MNFKNHLLLLPDKPDLERDALANACLKQGGEVQRIAKFWERPEVGNKKVSVYGFDVFCLVLAQLLDLSLVSVRDEWVVALDKKWTKRDLSIKLLKDFNTKNFPTFIKPVKPKLFQAKTYSSLDELQETTSDLALNELTIVSEIVAIAKEVRAFILNGKVLDLAYYEGKGELEAPLLFVKTFLQKSKVELPKTYVLDLGYNEKNGWFILEFNSTWGAGLNHCQAEKVIEAIISSTQ